MEGEDRHEAAERRWREVRRGWNRRGLRFALFLAIPLYPIFGLLDVVALPDEWLPHSIAMRFFVSVVGAILLFLLDHPQVRIRFVPISAAYTLVAGLGLSALTFLTGGFTSTYWSGLNLVMLAAGMLFVWPTRVSLGVYGVLVASFVFPSVYLYEPLDFVRAVESIFFVVSTAGLLLIAQAYRLRSLRFESDAQLRVEHLSYELKTANEHLEELARVDALTRVGNRRAFDERLAEEWSRMARTGTDLAVLILDVDNFKDFNDTFGHPAGDDCLKQLASVVDSNLARPGDFVSRYGGEEFAVILPSTDRAGAIRVAERLRKAVEGLSIEHAPSAQHPVVTVSIGGATTDAVDCDVAKELVSEADERLYEAKRAGRNVVAVTASAPEKLRESH